MTTIRNGHALVVRELGITTAEDDSALPLRSVADAALRHNPRRAHLLVSTVLGKHKPQRPKVIRATEELLAGRVLASLRGTTPDDHVARTALRDAVLNGTEPIRLQADTAFADDILVLGFAEAAAALGAGVAAHLGAWYACSTRYPTRAAHLVFQEEHSHATGHHLTPVAPGPLTDPNRIVVLVDDELTTGRTVQNIVSALLRTGGQTRYIVATITDLRTAADAEKLQRFAADHGVTIDVVSLHHSEFTAPADAAARAEPLLAGLTPSRPTGAAISSGVLTRMTSTPTPSLADGVRHVNATYAGPARTAAHTLASHVTGNVLVIGVEEDMYFPLLIADELEQTVAGDVEFGSTTRSPAFAYDNPEYGIRDRIEYDLPNGQRRYGYNFGENHDTIVVVSCAAADDLTDLITVLRRRADHVIHISARQPGPALAGPEFGSYSANDVTWLLTDVSGAAIELSVAEREAAVQAGQNYAEALPIEFIPSPAYQDLYDEALTRNAPAVAAHVGTVAQQVLDARGENVVLVSLARAGVPIGALMRRYLRTQHHINAQHYAISIVRGVGIDSNALDYIAARHNPADVIFVDGWTGKGAITRELAAAVDGYNAANGTAFPTDLAVLADPGRCATFSGTYDDYLIPSAALNSTVSGLISRTVYNTTLIGPADFHGGKFYRDLAEADVSNAYLDTVTAHFAPAESRHLSAPTWAGWAEVERLSTEYGVPNLNRIKPGVGETTRVLLRRVPWKVLVRSGAEHTIPHILRLAEERDVPIEPIPDLAFTAVGLIKDTTERTKA